MSVRVVAPLLLILLTGACQTTLPWPFAERDAPQPSERARLEAPLATPTSDDAANRGGTPASDDAVMARPVAMGGLY